MEDLMMLKNEISDLKKVANISQGGGGGGEE